MTITFQKEMFVSIMPELPVLFYEHWKEVAVDRDKIALDIDWARYVSMEAQGILHVMTARDDGVLIGYYTALVMTHLHFKQSRTAWSDMVFLLAPYRKTGKGLLTTGYLLICAAEKMLKNLRVEKSYLVTTTIVPVNILTKRLKYRPGEEMYSKLL